MNQKIENPKVLSQEAATLTSRFDLLIGELKNSISGEKKKNLSRQLVLPFSYAEFCELLTTEGTAVLEQKRQRSPFIIDSNNEPIIRQLHLYATRNEAFNGDLNKGFMLQGKIGCGKSILLESYASLLNRMVLRFRLSVPILQFVKSTELYHSLAKFGNEAYKFRPLAIDELGRESKTAMDFGNLTRPLSELLHLRADNGALTHGATNFTLETLSSDDYYGQMIGDRLRAMFNFMVMPGGSRRQ